MQLFTHWRGLGLPQGCARLRIKSEVLCFALYVVQCTVIFQRFTGNLASVVLVQFMELTPGMRCTTNFYASSLAFEQRLIAMQPTVLVELTQLRHRLLNHSPTDTNAAHQAPVAMSLPVFLARRVAQVHAAIKAQLHAKENTQGRHYTPKSPLAATQVPDPLRTPRLKYLPIEV